LDSKGPEDFFDLLCIRDVASSVRLSPGQSGIITVGLKVNPVVRIYVDFLGEKQVDLFIGHVLLALDKDV
jgi:hypothetical protein